MNQSSYELGLVSISFRKCSPEEIVRAVKNAGLTCIEWGSDVHAPVGNIERLREIAALQAEYGVTCSSYGTYFRLGVTPLADLPAYIAAAKILGTNVLRLWGGTKQGADMTPEELAAFTDTCKQAAAMAEEAGVILCLECHMLSVTETPDYAVALMEDVSSPAFRMYWQPFQWLDSEGSLAVAKAYAPYAEHIHVFNWHPPKMAPAKSPLAEAVEDWRAYLSVLPAPRALLLEFMPDDRIETLPAEAEALRTIIGG